ncbi:hypothetical protein [Aeromonas phage AS-yj]|uniref:Uncharacterized protein n=1 Tax=Aeromonas phage AS-yj TaxID=2026115 RepID=A0A291LE80_9CAUD|nr:hypothetical protein [Aeromonas phage AS-yj]UKM62851.1 hypothetical protein P19_0363 [Aeromonas phage P19]
MYDVKRVIEICEEAYEKVEVVDMGNYTKIKSFYTKACFIDEPCELVCEYIISIMESGIVVTRYKDKKNIVFKTIEEFSYWVDA